ncbi:MAG TPA: gamma carbonic anhydrase family protein [Mycobacteriales bacterium]|nr:gamma carbonic anhydrase family protein [Mycobacteriales bacterium]
MTVPTFILPLEGHAPEIDGDAFLAPGTSVIGRVQIGAQASVWYGSVLRGDSDQIRLGAGSNLQDGCAVHADPGYPVSIGDRVSIGHRAVIHGCTIDDDVLIGMGAVVLNGAHVGSGSLVAAGAVVLEGVDIPPNSLVAGVPGKVRRETSEAERERIRFNAEVYLHLAARHRAALS